MAYIDAFGNERNDDERPQESLEQIWARYNKQFEGLGENQQYATGYDFDGNPFTYIAPKNTSANPLSFKDALKTTFRNLTNFKDWNPLEGGNAADPTGGIAAFAGNKETQPFDYFTAGPLSKDQDFRDASRMAGRVVAGNVAAGALAGGAAGAETGAYGADAAGVQGGTDALSGGPVGEFDWLEGLDMGGGYDPGSLGGLEVAGDATLPAGMAGSAGSSGMSLESITAAAKSLGVTPASLAKLLPSLLGAAGAKNQASGLQGLQGQYENYGAPSRARYEQSMSAGFDPNSIPGYAGALDSASKSILARLSAGGGNPFGNPGGLIDAQKQIVSGTAMPAINEFQRLNAATGFGQTLNSAGGFGQSAIGAQGNIYNAVGAGLNDVLNPPQTLAQQLAALKQAGLYSPNSLG